MLDNNAYFVSEFAVLVFVHGDSWSWGSSHLYDARIMATLGRIIVVTFNYRLGVFGINPIMSSADLQLQLKYFRFSQHESLSHDKGSRG